MKATRTAFSLPRKQNWDGINWESTPPVVYPVSVRSFTANPFGYRPGTGRNDPHNSMEFCMKALIFDLDGVIVDTESCDWMTWRDVFREHGAELPYEKWTDWLGVPYANCDCCATLERYLGRSVDHEAVAKDAKQRYRKLAFEQPVMPGVAEYLDKAKALGLKTAVASSSTRDWLEGHLSRLGLLERFDVTRCFSEVERGKPAPDVYLAALDALGVSHREALALEDSPNGVRAAKAAGLFCVAAPNLATKTLDFGEADLCIDGLAETPLEALLEHAREHHRAATA